MDDRAQEERTPSAGTDAQKRKPPKIRRKPSESTPEHVERELKSNPPAEKPNPDRESGADTGDDTVSIDRHSLPQDEPSEPSTPSKEQSPLPPKGSRRHHAKRTVVLDRKRDAPPEVWRRRNSDREADQQLLPLTNIGDLGETVNEAGNLVRNVGTKAVNSVGDTAVKTVGNAVGGLQHQEKEKEEQLRLRLDLNLDIEVQLKAKIHGDLTLQLLN